MPALAVGLRRPKLGNSLAPPQVLRVGDGLEVSRVYALRITAKMVYRQPSGDWSLLGFIHHSVRVYPLAVDQPRPVPIGAFVAESSEPKPASSIRLRYVPIL